MIKAVLKANKTEISDDTIKLQAKDCFENFSISLIDFPDSEENGLISKLESLLRKGLEPKPYNAAKTEFKSDKMIIDLLK